jgi:hypothetical protein
MIKTTKTLFLILIWLLTEISAFSQYYVKFKGDSLGFEIDSVILALDSMAGNIYWEVSKDTVSWTSLNEKNDTLYIRIDSSAFYRAVLTGGSCYPVKSSIALVSFKSIAISGKTVVIDSAGGIYFLPSGIKLTVPPGAVKENTTLSFDLLDLGNADFKIPFHADTGKVFCSGIYCDPAEVRFLKPVRISIPAPNYQYSDLPYVYLYDSYSNTWEKHTGLLTCSENKHFIEFSTDKPLSARVHLIKNLFGPGMSPKSYKGEQEDCKSGIIQVQSMSHDFIGSYASGDCNVNSDEDQVAFLDCPGKPTGTSRIQEIGKYCKPQVAHSIDKDCLSRGESATMTINVTIGGLPLSDQHITINLPAGLSTPGLLIVTDNFGNARFTVTCNADNFTGTISYKVYIEYYLQVVEASADGRTETGKNFKQTLEIEGAQKIGCVIPQIKFIELTRPDGYKMHVNETVQLSSICRDEHGSPVNCGILEYYVSSSAGGGAVDIDASGIIKALKPGIVFIKALSSGIESNSVGISIAYEGTLTCSRETDHSIYNQCGCKNPETNKWDWYDLTFSGSYAMAFWLNIDLDADPSAEINGLNTITYEITSDYCKDTLIYEQVKSEVYSLDIDQDLNRVLTQDVIDGKEFGITFWYNDFRYLNNFISLGGHMNQSGMISITIKRYIPDECVLYIDGSCVLN